jgi:hypothetical protein
MSKRSTVVLIYDRQELLGLIMNELICSVFDESATGEMESFEPFLHPAEQNEHFVL